MVTFIFWMLLINTSVYGTTDQDMLALKNHLFDNSRYDKSLRPQCNDTTVTLTLDMSIRQILELNDPTQLLKMEVWMRTAWQDCRLTWDTLVYNVSHIVVPFDEVWVPDLSLYNTASEETFHDIGNYRPDIYPGGAVYFNFPAVITTFCKLDVTYFPYDEQNCDLQLGSWVFHGDEINIVAKKTAGDLAQMKDNAVWDVTGFPVTRDVSFYPCCTSPYPSLTFFVQMRRRSSSYALNLIFPCILVAGLSYLGYILPVESGEKVSLQITVMLSLSVFLLIISENLPPSSESIPILDELTWASQHVPVLASHIVIVISWLGHTTFDEFRTFRWTSVSSSLRCCQLDMSTPPPSYRKYGYGQPFLDNHLVSVYHHFITVVDENHLNNSIYFAAVMTLIAISCVSTVIVINVHFTHDKSVPPWIRKYIINGLGRFLCHTSKPKVKDFKRETHENNSPKETEKTAKTIDLIETLSPNGLLHSSLDSKTVILLESISKQHEDSENEATRASEWRKVCEVINRASLVLTLVFGFVVSVAIFAQISS